MISYLWSTYSHDTTLTPCGIAASEASAELSVRRAFEAEAAIRGAAIWVVTLKASPDGRQFEWHPVKYGPIFARNDKHGVVKLPQA
jgi:hypothetical protein